MTIKDRGLPLAILLFFLVVALLIVWRSSSTGYATLSGSEQVASIPTYVPTAIPTQPVGTQPDGSIWQPNTNFSCDQVAPASKSACLAQPPDPTYQGGVPAIQPSAVSSDLTKAAVTVDEVRSYVNQHILLANGTPVPILSIDLLTAAEANSKISGGIQGPSNALVYYVVLQGPFTVQTSLSTISGPTANVIYSAATGNQLAWGVPPYPSPTPGS